MHCFYIESPAGGTAALPADEAKHAAKVLRLKTGDEVCAMDGAGRRWRAEIESVGGGVTVRLLDALPANEPSARVTVYQGVPKSDKLDFLAQKLTELGITALVPVQMSRCVARLDDKDGEKRRVRLQRIANEAAKQCQRATPLRVDAPISWSAALERMRAHDALLVPWEEARSGRLKEAFAARPAAADIGLVIGPEGGMSAEEVAALNGLGGLTVTLGPRILRAETASVTAAALVMSLWGDV